MNPINADSHRIQKLLNSNNHGNKFARFSWQHLDNLPSVVRTIAYMNGLIITVEVEPIEARVSHYPLRHFQHALVLNKKVHGRAQSTYRPPSIIELMRGMLVPFRVNPSGNLFGQFR
jgi:hypothetical protein